MRNQATRASQQKQHMERSMAAIEAAARKQYALDKQAEEQHQKSQQTDPPHGNLDDSNPWEYHHESGYYYNAVHKWYFDHQSRMYYGGDPPDWTDKPTIPAEAVYGVGDTKDRQPSAMPTPAPSPASASMGTKMTTHPSPSVGASSRKKPYQTVFPGQKIQAHAHPLGGVGGYQMPRTGRIGGAKGIGYASSGARDSKQSTSDTAGKRKRDDSKPISTAEAEAMARREAARQRVQARTMANFGLK